MTSSCIRCGRPGASMCRACKTMKTKVYHDTEYTSNRRLMLEQFTPGHTVCGICHRVIASVAVMSIDHVIAVRRGGSHSRGNLQYAHRSCNSSKQSG